MQGKRNESRDSLDSPAVGLEISEYERQVLWQLAEYGVTVAVSDLVTTDADGEPRLSREAQDVRSRAEGWFRLLDDFGWELEPARSAVLTDVEFYAPLLAKQRDDLADELRAIAEARPEELYLGETDRIEREDRERVDACGRILARMGTRNHSTTASMRV